MSYVTGTAGSFAGLLEIIEAALISAGYTQSGQVFHKGGLYCRLWTDGIVLQAQGGTGVDGGNNLVNPGPHYVSMRPFAVAAFTWPAQYHIHINTDPDEVYVFLRYGAGGEFFQRLSFGRSSLPLPGTGNWYSATCGNANLGGISVTATTGGYTGTGGQALSGGLFWDTNGGSAQLTPSLLHHGLDGGGWTGITSASNVGGLASCPPSLAPLVATQPNTWNGEAVLLPVRPVIARVSSRYSCVADLAHARFVRNDNIEPAGVLTLGPDQWVVYPFFRKDIAGRIGSTTPIQHSGTFALAVRIQE